MIPPGSSPHQMYRWSGQNTYDMKGWVWGSHGHTSLARILMIPAQDIWSGFKHGLMMQRGQFVDLPALARQPGSGFLKDTGFSLVNQLAVRSLAVETWKGLVPSVRDGGYPLAMLFGQPVHSSTRVSLLQRTQTSGKKIPNRHLWLQWFGTATRAWEMLKHHPVEKMYQ